MWKKEKGNVSGFMYIVEFYLIVIICTFMHTSNIYFKSHLSHTVTIIYTLTI